MSPGPGGGASHHRPAPTEEKCFEKMGEGGGLPILGPGLDEMLDKVQSYNATCYLLVHSHTLSL